MIRQLQIMAALLLLAGGLWAQQMTRRVPARMDPIVRVQPDGDSLTVLLRGDEHSHILMTVDGWEIGENSKGYLCYKKKRACGTKIVSCKKAHSAERRTCPENRWLVAFGVRW